MATFTYPTSYPSPPANVAHPPYAFDNPYAGADISADFTGSGYNGLAFGFLEFGYGSTGTVSYNRSDMTLCQSTGRGLDCAVRQKYSGKNYKAMVTIGDFVGDGMPAIMVQTLSFTSDMQPTKTGQIEVCRVTGDDTTASTGTDNNMSCQSWPGAILKPADGRVNDRFYFMDLFGTGRPQLVQYHGGYFNGTWQEDGTWNVYEPIDRAAPGQALDRIYAVTNGLGAVSTVEYADGLPAGIVKQQGTTDLGTNTYPRHVALHTGKIVSSLRVANGEGRQRTTTYTYASPAIDVAGRGTLGFGSVTATDADTGIVTATRYSLRWPFDGMVRDETKTYGAVQISTVSNSLATKTLTHDTYGTTQFPYVFDSVVITNDLNRAVLSTMATATHDPDDYGNMTSHNVSSLGGVVVRKSFQTATTTTYKNDATNWLIGLPETVTVSKTDSDYLNPEDGTHTVSRHIHNSYDATTGLLSSSISEEGAAQYQVQTDYLRTGNVFGLVSQQTQTWNNLQSASTATRSQTSLYDDHGRYPQTVTNAAGHSTTSTYDPTNGAPLTVKDANGLTTAWTLNGYGRARVELRPDGSETHTDIKRCAAPCQRGAAVVQITEHYFAGSRTTVPTLVYSDNVGHPVSTQTFDLLGAAAYADQTYDALGRPDTSYQPAYANATLFMSARQEYDVLDRVKKRCTLDEGNNELCTTTDYNGLVTVFTDPNTHNRTETRDALGQLVQVTDALNGVTSMTYEPFGNLTTATDPSGNVSKIAFDRLGHRTKLQDPDLGTITYSPDQFGHVLVQQTAEQAKRGDRTDIGYDMLDRMTARYERDLRGNWIYDTAANGKGQLAEAYTGTSTAKDYRRLHSYDSYSRPSTVTTILSDASYTSTPGYDAWGRPTSQTSQRGTDAAKTFNLRYTSFGYLGSIERGALVLWRAVSSDAAGRITGAALGNGLVETTGYSPSSTRLVDAQVTNGAGVVRVHDSYQYDAIGDVSLRTQQWSTHGFSELFTYDELNRLKTTTIGSDIKTLVYYGDGRIKSKTGVGSGDYVYPGQGAASIRPHAVANIPGIGDFGYDDNGNLKTGAGRTATWTSFDMPQNITKGSSSSTFVYGPEYQRARQDRGDLSNVVYAGTQEIETSSAKAVTVKTYWPNGIGVEIDRPGATATELSWIHKDRLGSPIMISDDAGNVREELAYDAWGKRRDTNANSTPDTVDGKTDNKGFTGHEMLDQLDLVHMNGRVYDPLIGRFMSGDPLVQDPGNGQNLNRYSYVLNNPTNFTDPTGFDCEKDHTGCPPATAHGFTLLPFMKCFGDCGKDAGGSGQTGSGTGKKVNPAGSDRPNAKNNSTNLTTSANSGGGGGGGFFSNLGEKLKNAVVSGAFWTDAEKNAWGRGLQIAIANGSDADYMRQYPFGAAIKDIAAIAVTGGAAATERAVVQQIEAKMVEQAANSLGKSAEKMAIDNAEHIFAKGRFDGIGSQKEIAAGIGDAVRNSAGKLVEGDNTITTLINNQTTTIRMRLQDGAVSNVNAFPGVSTRTLGNMIDLR